MGVGRGVLAKIRAIQLETFVKCLAVVCWPEPRAQSCPYMSARHDDNNDDGSNISCNCSNFGPS